MATFVARMHNGQVVVPEAIREALHLEEDTIVRFIMEEGRAFLASEADVVSAVRSSIPTPPHMSGGHLDAVIDEAIRACFGEDSDPVSSTRGIFAPVRRIETEDFDELIDEAMSDHADWVVERMRRGEE